MNNDKTFILKPIGTVHKIDGKDITFELDKFYYNGAKQLSHFSHAHIIYSEKSLLKHQVIKLQKVNEQHGIICFTTHTRIQQYAQIFDIKPYFPCEDRIKEANGLEDNYSFGQCRLTEDTTPDKDKTWTTSAIGEIRKLNGECFLYFKPGVLEDNNTLNDSTYIRIFWWFHRFDTDRYRKVLTGNPPYKNAPRTGVFASRSPVRPNPVAMTIARILQFDLINNRIKVSALDCFDHTPFIHIAPYQPDREKIDDFRVPEWLSHWPEWWKEENTIYYKDTDMEEIPDAGKDHSQCINTDFYFDEPEDTPLPSPDCIDIRGASQNNLQAINIKIPYHKVTVVTGVSGSGKSSLVFDTVFAESQRRFMDSMSVSERSAFDQAEKPQVESITGLPPAIAISQKSIGRNPRSTVGTITDIYNYLSTLFAGIGKRHCPECGSPVKQVCNRCNRLMFDLTPSTFSFNNPESMCPVCRGLGVKMEVDVNKIITEPDKSLLDGASPYWNDLRKFRQNPNANWMKGELLALAETMNIDLEKPWSKLTGIFRQRALYGSEGMEVTFSYSNKNGRTGNITRVVEGAVNVIKRLFAENVGQTAQRIADEFMKKAPCDCCGGERLSAEARMIKIAGSRFPQVASLSISALKEWVQHLPTKLNDEEREIAMPVLKELYKRLTNYERIGIPYLTLNRSLPTLSGGELQRIKLANQLGSGISNILYILDEPSAGLHAKDYGKLMKMIHRLKDLGNTVIMVEHEEEFMRQADYLIDIGPGAGIHGGKVVAQGTPDEIIEQRNSETGLYLSGEKQVYNKIRTNLSTCNWIKIDGVKYNNLKNITVTFPDGAITCVTGVSGSGKSSLVSYVLYPAIKSVAEGKSVTEKHWGNFTGAGHFLQVIQVTQQPIGRTPRSNPATYTGLMDQLRILFAGTEQSKARGYKSNKFSFNSKEGQCPVCKGEGRKCVEVHFMPDIWTLCTACKGKRFNPEALQITYRNKTIADVLNMNVSEALEFLGQNTPAGHILEILSEIGLGYIKLGQSALTLSGGEAQRIKLAKELSVNTKGKTLYLLDEPTSGLHFSDIQNLLIMLRKITQKGNTVVIIEHNKHIINNADWVIELGPEGGDKGGAVIKQEAVNN